MTTDNSRSLAGETDDPTVWQAMFESLLDGLPEAAFAVDTEGSITHWNDAVASLIGLPASEAIGMDAYDIFGTEGHSETLAETVVRTGEAVRESEFRSAGDADEEQAHARAIGVPIRSADGSVTGAVEILLDVSEVVEQRETLHELQVDLSESVKSSVDELGASTSDVAQQSREISDLAAEQATDLTEVQSEVSGFSATIEEIASSAEEVSNQSSKATSLAGDSVQTATDVSEQVGDVAAESADVATKTERLSQRIDEIQEFVAVIDDIADQTNMLALNANIEAARSEGNNDGFAVVADEIKDLADESKQHATEIETTVEEIREMATETAERVRETNGSIQAVEADIEAIIDNQETIRAAITETDEGVTEIASATDDQAASAEEIASMIDGVADRADDVADAVEAIASETDTQAHQIDTLEDDVDRVETRLDTVMD
ncbi:methyl-accepting chemotaxis protein [Halorhabdus salina]|uniref:methyl-accepting chemotaxis protein n=1 Tax=Halorhabdus salina TaxID=2750670 RepID=UPI00215D5F0E|nr:methyl-accepting chemotaxis protein [Halorhabdus salina]